MPLFVVGKVVQAKLHEPVLVLLLGDSIVRPQLVLAAMASTAHQRRDVMLLSEGLITPSVFSGEASMSLLRRA